MSRQQLTPADYEEHLGEALRILRRRTGKPQYLLAKEAGITKAMLSGYERRGYMPSLPTLFKVLVALGADFAALGDAIYLLKGFPPPARTPAHPVQDEPLVLPLNSGDVCTAGVVRIGGVIRIELSLPAPLLSPSEKS